MKIVIVIPTYNEAENIGKLIPILLKDLSVLTQHDCHVLVVDGNSPDGTGGVVTNLSHTYPQVHLLLEKEKRGLGNAYVYGFRHAMSELGADVVVEMDADFQHDPADVKRLVAEIDNGADYVIGSRYINGGSIPKEWAFHRRMLSWGGNIVSKLILNIYTVSDFTSGFKASRVKGFVDTMNLDNILSKGFAYKIDLLFKMHKLGAKIKEVPIVFGLRDRGDSKMERNNTMDSLKVVCMIRMNENKNFVKFLMVGFTGLFVDATLFNILRLVFERSYIASSISGLVAMLTTYTFNNLWSFRERKIVDNKKFILTFVVYALSSYVPILFRSWLIAFCEVTFGSTLLVDNAAFFVGILLGLVWNFTVYNKIIWRKN